MLRGMVFVDHMNFNIALGDYYSSFGKKTPNLDYNTIFKGIVSLVPNVGYTKATVFAPEPDQKLGKVIPEVDDYIILEDSFFSQHIRIK